MTIHIRTLADGRQAKIKTSYDPPPVPWRHDDWTAIDDSTYDGAPDSGNRHHIGSGTTEAEAIEDLIEILEG